MRKIFLWIFFILLTSALLLSGCSNTPDAVEDPLSAFGIDTVLPFETIAPEAMLPTPSPAPTPDIDNLPSPTDFGQGWKADGTVTGQQTLDDDVGDFDDFDDFDAPTVTPRPTAAAQSGYARLASGSSGSGVRSLQNRLKALGYYTGTVDGQFGSGTVTAVKKFQSIMGYDENGVATAALQQLLFASNAPRYVAPTTPAPTAQYVQLAKGDSGSRVTRLQNRLKTLGYFTGTADGQFGSATVNSVKRFQDALGLTQTGAATVALQQKLFSSSAPYYEGEEPTPAPPIADEYIRLAQGSNGSRVKNLQNRLKTLGYFSGTADGQYGSATVAAVRNFQRAVGVDATGVATISLQRTLYGKNAPYYEGDDEPATPDGYVLLSPGDTGTQVKNLQTRLKALGYFDGDIGGNYLTKTTDAVKLFQKTTGVTQTGIATAALQKKIFSSTAPKYKATATPEPAYIELSEGDSNDRVKKLQQRLTDLGYYSGSVNGNFGARTADAIKLFEARYGKPKTGLATVALQKKLFASDALAYKADVATPEPSSGYVRLEKGATGEKVKALQRRLKALGYFEGAIGGNYQQLTTDAVKRFQAEIGVKQNGIATVALQEMIFGDDAPVYQKSTDTTVESGPATSYKKLQRSDTGAAVKQLQQRLIELGYIKSASDVKLSTFDKATMLAVIDAQNARSYDSDGVADVDFLTYIYSDYAWDYALAGYEGG